jgi:hypothetical protein
MKNGASSMRAISQATTPIIPLLSDVTPAEDLSIIVTWKEGQRAPRTEKIDLAPLINSLKIYKALRDDRALFKTVHLLDEMGDIIVWGRDNAIDMDSSTIERFAEDMMTADDFNAFLGEMDYTQNTAAAMLGYSRRQIANYITGFSPIPRVCSLACAALRLRNPTLKPPIHHIAWITYANTFMRAEDSDFLLPVTNTQLQQQAPAGHVFGGVQHAIEAATAGYDAT